MEEQLGNLCGHPNSLNEKRPLRHDRDVDDLVDELQLRKFRSFLHPITHGTCPSTQRACPQQSHHVTVLLVHTGNDDGHLRTGDDRRENHPGTCHCRCRRREEREEEIFGSFLFLLFFLFLLLHPDAAASDLLQLLLRLLLLLLLFAPATRAGGERRPGPSCTSATPRCTNGCGSERPVSAEGKSHVPPSTAAPAPTRRRAAPLSWWLSSCPVGRRSRCPPCRTSGGTPLPAPLRSTAARVANTSAVVAPSSVVRRSQRVRSWRQLESSCKGNT